MKKLVNFSHPLSEKASARLTEMVGEFEEIVVKVQLDLDAALKPQLDTLVDAGMRARMDLYIPPSLAVAAAYVTAKLSYAQSDAMLPQPPAMVVLRREGTPPQFIPAEILLG